MSEYTPNSNDVGNGICWIESDELPDLHQRRRRFHVARVECGEQEPVTDDWCDYYEVYSMRKHPYYAVNVNHFLCLAGISLRKSESKIYY